jgi:hypothetical protein
MQKLFSIIIILIFHSVGVNAQQIITEVKNTVILKKGSVALPQVRYKTGEMVMMKNTEEGMNFYLIKNGKTTAMFDPCVDCIFGQVAEIDIDGDGKTEVLLGTRMSTETFEVKIYKKAEFEVDYKLFTTINGQDHCEFSGDNTVKIYTSDLKVAHLKFKSDGSWIVLEQ